MRDAFDRRELRLRQRVVHIGQSIDLRHDEGLCVQEGDLAIDLVAVGIGMGFVSALAYTTRLSLLPLRIWALSSVA
jgi:hypothetical protein